jgi:hypothetical protein
LEIKGIRFLSYPLAPTAGTAGAAAGSAGAATAAAAAAAPAAAAAAVAAAAELSAAAAAAGPPAAAASAAAGAAFLHGFAGGLRKWNTQAAMCCNFKNWSSVHPLAAIVSSRRRFIWEKALSCRAGLTRCTLQKKWPNNLRRLRYALGQNWLLLGSFMYTPLLRIITPPLRTTIIILINILLLLATYKRPPIFARARRQQQLVARTTGRICLLSHLFCQFLWQEVGAGETTRRKTQSRTTFFFSHLPVFSC